ncbi:MAG TPA: serine/threonine-protein kinase [Humisphaera sp.]|jgi:hypothetical protein|nr:serine/threonine-protein kinase [Humisphaera sp.]
MPAQSEMSIFMSALSIGDLAERDAFLNDACAGNPTLREEVEALLRAHDLPDNPLDELPGGVEAVRSILQAARETDESTDRQAVAEGPGAIIGRYKIMEQIGEGGVGLVFVAAQQRPVRRMVALKVIKPGMDTREVITRFEAERQALAMMDHPNIASVLDAGVTDTGRPYFVMELVRGVPITDYCDHHRLDTRARLELFITVCQAVQHAHQKGIIHRDLKPSNVMVTVIDGAPVVKVIDFGVAKAVGPRLTEQTIYTRFTQMIGTPMYMSPEQAEMSSLDVDTRSDIYSLGVLLYELLTGTTPFDRERMRTAAFDDVRRIVREEEPPTPSSRLTTLGQGISSVSATRRTEPARLLAQVRGDLDWIVMKAMDKNRARRYETAAALAQDARRYLGDEPVEAQPPSTLYRFRKFARRNKLTLTTIALVAAALLLGTAASLWQAVRADRATAEALTLRKKAEDFADRLKASNVLIATGRDHMDQGRWALANADYTRAAQLEPNHFLAWSGRGSMFSKLGLWKLAADDYLKAEGLGAASSGPGWWNVPETFLYVGDEASYRRARERMIGQIAKSSDSFAIIQMIRCCTMAPLPQGDADKLVRAAEAQMALPTQAPGRQQGPGRGFRGPFYNYAAGLAHYRAGDDRRAIERINESITNRWPQRGIAFPALAMALHRDGQDDKARNALTSGERWMDQWFEEMRTGAVGTMPLPPGDWLECQLTYREAHQLVLGTPAPDDPRWRALEARATAALGQQ